MDIRPYAPADRAACLAVFDSLFDDPAARAAFAARLDAAAPFFVAEHDGIIIGCGGFSVAGAAARLEWGMVHKNWQRQGLGRFLLFYRMKAIGQAGAVEMVTAEAQRAYADFYLKQGFRESGGDATRVLLAKRLAVCA